MNESKKTQATQTNNTTNETTTATPRLRAPRIVNLKVKSGVKAGGGVSGWVIKNG